MKVDREAVYQKCGGRCAYCGEAREAAAKCVPSNWLDPLLTGDNAIRKEWLDTAAIEKLLNAIRERILKLQRSTEKGEKDETSNEERH
jgi:hypothetical protein